VCRLFGLSAAPNRVRATFWLLDASDSLAVQSRQEPDGVGLGVFAPDGTPQVHKRPLAAYQDAEFARETREVQAATFLAHVRFASTGPVELANTHPFLQDGRLFAHNGVVGGLGRLEASWATAVRWWLAAPTRRGYGRESKPVRSRRARRAGSRRMSIVVIRPFCSVRAPIA